MSKYDFENDLSVNSSTGMILSKIRPHSIVLEFGCATGRMTRYMKEELKCQVYIVEYDKSAFREAKKFAQDGICDDILNYRWLERFSGIAFDTIIFADVLEHLSNPEEVLKKAAGLLKEDGTVFVSVPNVTHNDILLRAIEEHFDYSETGLLDNTHIHFWGLENIKTLGKDAGLTVRKLEGTYCAMGDTEQKVQKGKNLLLENILRERSAGEVYQFVLTMDKQGSADPVCTLEASGIYSNIYLDTGSDFNAQEQIPVRSAYSGSGSYLVHYELAAGKTLRRVRLDPAEGQGVILRHVSICQSGKELKLIMPNAVDVNGEIYLHSKDPMVIAQLEPGDSTIVVDAEFVLPGVQYLRTLENAVWMDQQAIEQARQQAEQQMRQWSQQLLQVNEQLRQLEQQNEQLQTDVCAYIVLVNQKEKLVLGLEQQANAYLARIRDLESVREYYQNLKVIKLRSWAGRALRKIKRGIKKLLRRG